MKMWLKIEVTLQLTAQISVEDEENCFNSFRLWLALGQTINKISCLQSSLPDENDVYGGNMCCKYKIKLIL